MQMLTGSHSLHTLPRKILTSAVLLSMATFGAAAASAIDFELQNGSGKSITEMEIGDDLFLHVSNVLPAEEGTYTVTLRHVGHNDIRAMDVVVGANASTVLLWENTGVGCDPCEDPDPEAHIFEKFEDASAHLAGGTLFVDIVDFLNQPAASFNLPVVALGQQMHTFVGNAYDCPVMRNRAAGEDLRLVVQNPAARMTEMRVFIVNSLQANSDGSIPLIDARGTSYLNGQVITPGTSDFSEALWIAPPNDECKLYFVVRRAYGGITDDTPVLQKGDDVVETLDLRSPLGNGTGNNPGTSTPDGLCEIC